MKKSVLFLLLPLMINVVNAQNALTITSGTDLYISSSNILNIEGLSLSPSSAFTLNGVSLAKNTSPVHSGLTTTVSRTYLFNTTVAPFSGTIRFYYNDAELNGLSESSLLLQAHNGTVWQTFDATNRDAVNNYIEAANLSSQTLAELALNANTLLPLSWRQVSAKREQSSVVVKWFTSMESNLAHFSVERNTNNMDWHSIADGIKPAGNAGEQQYSYIDAFSSTARTAYRIRQTDRDGRYTYSPVAVVAAVDDLFNVLIYPNPVANKFTVQTSNVANIKEMQLFHTSGMLVKKWQTTQTSYTIEHLPTGVYQLCILEKNGNKHFLPIIKN